MQSPVIPFHQAPPRLEEKLARFNARKEVNWFGFRGSFVAPGSAVITFTQFEGGLLGGGGTAAINGGVISAGFDALFVLAGLGHYESEVVVTLELSVKFLSLALVSESLEFRGHVVRSAKNFSFAEGFLHQTGVVAERHLAIATAMIAPARE
jgi:acyl-coenzyme A thioesterase PaaI-like protein